MSTIHSIHARQILDSRGTPTVEVDVTLEDGSVGRAAVPSGASTGSHEALELRDADLAAYFHKGVEHAVENVETKICPALIGKNAQDQAAVDALMLELDGTPHFNTLGANAVLGVSLATSKAAAASLKQPYYAYIAQLFGQPGQYKLPRPMFNILNGGAHTHWQTTDIQEFMVVPLSAPNFREALRWGDEIYHALESVLEKRGLSTNVGDEGGFAPAVHSDEEALQLVLEAIQAAGYTAGKQVGIAIDAAVSALFQAGKYELKLAKRTLSSQEMISYWADLLQKYPIISLEDPLAEDDWATWSALYAQLGSKVQVVGDDLLVTNIERIQQAITAKACNCLLMKPNQIGTLSQSLEAIKVARSAGWGVIVSHRSGETEDTSIADIAVGTSAGQIKTGAPDRSERVAKYNQLLRIEEELGL